MGVGVGEGAGRMEAMDTSPPLYSMPDPNSQQGGRGRGGGRGGYRGRVRGGAARTQGAGGRGVGSFGGRGGGRGGGAGRGGAAYAPPPPMPSAMLMSAAGTGEFILPILLFTRLL